MKSTFKTSGCVKWDGRGVEKCTSSLPTFVENVKFGEDIELLREVKKKNLKISPGANKAED